MLKKMNIIRKQYHVKLNNAKISSTRFIIILLESHDIYFTIKQIKNNEKMKIIKQLKFNYCMITMMMLFSFLFKKLMKEIENIHFISDYKHLIQSLLNFDNSIRNIKDMNSLVIIIHSQFRISIDIEIINKYMINEWENIVKDSKIINSILLNVSNAIKMKLNKHIKRIMNQFISDSKVIIGTNNDVERLFGKISYYLQQQNITTINVIESKLKNNYLKEESINEENIKILSGIRKMIRILKYQLFIDYNDY